MQIKARLVSRSAPHVLPGKLWVAELWFEVPLDYSQPNGKKIKLFAKDIRPYVKPISGLSTLLRDERPPDLPYLVYLEGGPGFGNQAPNENALTPHMLHRGYALLLLDYRGTGLSSPISGNVLEKIGTPEHQADYLKLFRADTIVRDCEAVRTCLTWNYPASKQKWTIFGQSFGGMTALTYLSMHPESLQEAYITGGLVSLDQTPDEIYVRTFRKVVERNHAFYAKYPQDVSNVKALAAHIHKQGGQQGIPMPAGGRLTVPYLMTLGHKFGVDGGLDRVHDLVLKANADLAQFGAFTQNTLNKLEQTMAWDANPVYSILHEAIWCNRPGMNSRWAADRVGKSMAEFRWLDMGSDTDATTDPSPSSSPGNSNAVWQALEAGAEPLYFSGEMIFPFFFDSFPDLARMKEAAHILAAFDGWTDLYDAERLARNEVPVYAAIFNDMYVDTETSRVTAKRIKGCKTWESNVLFHNALRSRGCDVLKELFALRDDTID